jgi:hypothetical protein
MASSKRGVWFKFGRFITGLTIACFFLPFFGVSCDGMDVITISGADMVGGCRPGGLLADAADQKKSRGGTMDGDDDMKGDIKIDKVPREPLAIVALGLALVVFGLSWVRSRGAMTGAGVLSIACIGALIGLYVKVGGKMKDDVAAQTSKKDLGSRMMADSKTKVDAGARFGLWASCLGLMASAALCGLALREPEGTENMPRTPPGPPPAG